MSEKIQKIREYIESKNPEFAALGLDTDIIENRLIDSLHFVEFILFVEEVACAKIDMEAIDIEDFRSLDRIDAFLTRLVQSPHQLTAAAS